jgi:hypothetical protein
MAVQGQRGNAADRLQRVLPPAAWATLEALVMEPRQLAAELEAGDDTAGQKPAQPTSPGASATCLDNAGHRALMTNMLGLGTNWNEWPHMKLMRRVQQCSAVVMQLHAGHRGHGASLPFHNAWAIMWAFRAEHLSG